TAITSIPAASASAAMAVCSAGAAGVPLERALAGLAGAEISQWRMDVAEAASGAFVINDAYNANPTSMRAALAALAALDAERRVAIIGLMAELGDEGPAEHTAIAAEAEAAGIEVIAVDAPIYGSGVEHVPDREAAAAALGPVGAGDAVLVKGSRVAGLEELAAELVGPR
ncbi:MAG: cyanophycin synthetase, partial [Actinomycetota bacterium]